MPRRIIQFFLLLVLVAACGGDPEVEPSPSPTPVVEVTTEATVEPTAAPTQTPTPIPTPTPEPVEPLTGKPIADESLYDLPVVAVKIDNDPDARPQVGLANADIVFVEPIEVLTRLVAFFHSGGEGEVGPVRSGRRIDPKLFGVFDPIFAFSGAAGPNYATIDAGFPDTVVNDRNLAGWRREGTRRAPHNLFIPLETIRDRFPDHDGPGEQTAFAFDDEVPAGGTDIAEFTVSYSPLRTLSGWTWDGEGWERSQNGTPHTSGSPDRGEEGTQIVSTNVVVLTVPWTGIQAEPITVLGEGQARIHRDGQVFDGTWTKVAEDDQYTFADADGQVIPLAPGNTWLEIMPSTGAYTEVAAG